jgi:hypothetical protein
VEGWRRLLDDNGVVFHVCATKTWREWRYRSIHLNPVRSNPGKELQYSMNRRLVGFRTGMENLEKRCKATSYFEGSQIKEGLGA